MGSLSDLKDMLFSDNKRFTRLADGRIAYKTDCSNWAKVFENNLPLDDHFHALMAHPLPCIPKLPSLKKEKTKKELPFRERRLRYNRKKNPTKTANMMSHTWEWGEENEDITWKRICVGCRNVCFRGDVCVDCGFTPSRDDCCYGCGYYNGCGSLCSGCRTE